MACLDENQVLALAHGRLEGDALLAAQQHLDGCSDCLDLVGFYQQSAREACDEADTQDHEFVPLSDSEEMDLNVQEGAKIGRYEVMHALGRGGMGVVYLARDPELDRRVALKLVKPSLHSDERADHFQKRLMREARAMAKLNHPNVLTIYDVGIEGGQVFLASEWVDGCTMDEWMSEGPHRWPAIAMRFREAARGLVAAHAAGLVHRDFKPSNVMIGKDERVHVFDFGLVKATTANIGDITTQLSGNFVVGTPAYMAPEQMLGKVADERSDQFSFCASMYEALTGLRPFQGRNLTELLRNIAAGKVEEPKKVPKWLWELIRRGLNKKPEERHESMAAILKILDARMGHRRRRTVMAVALALALGAGAVTLTGMWRDHMAGSDHCSNLEVELGQAWSAERRTAVHDALTTSELPFASEVGSRTVQIVDAYAERWQEELHSSCVETRITRQQSLAILQRRNNCFTRLGSELNLVTSELSEKSSPMVTAAVSLALGLSPIESCSGSRAPGEFLSQEDEATKQRLRELWPKVKEVESLVLLGDYRASLAKSELLLAQKHVNRRQEARLWKSRGKALRMLGDYQEAVAALESCFYAAVAGRHDEMAAHATTELFSLLIVNLHDEERASRWRQLADSAVERVQSSLATGHWHMAQGRVALAQQDLGEAEKQFRKAITIFESELGEGQLELPRAVGALARGLAQSGELSLAQANLERAVKLSTRLVGSSHPDTATAQIDLAAVMAKQGRHSAAVAMATESVRAMVVALGEENMRVAWALNSLAGHSVAEGNYAAASSALLRALRIKRGIHGNAHPSLVSPLSNLMEVDRMLARHSDAVLHGNEALQILLKTPSEAKSDATRRLKIGVAEARLASGDAEGSMTSCKEVQSELPAGTSASATLRGRVASCLGRAHIAMGHQRDGRAMLEQARVDFGTEGARHRLAVALFALAKLNVGRSASREKAIADAEQAALYFDEAGLAWAPESEEVGSWLRAQADSR